jgi:hypothetical protein
MLIVSECTDSPAKASDTARPKLDELIAYVRDGDEVIVHSMDRLARNLDDLRRLVRTQIAGRGDRSGAQCLQIHPQSRCQAADQRYEQQRVDRSEPVAVEYAEQLELVHEWAERGPGGDIGDDLLRVQAALWK